MNDQKCFQSSTLCVSNFLVLKLKSGKKFNVSPTPERTDKYLLKKKRWLLCTPSQPFWPQTLLSLPFPLLIPWPLSLRPGDPQPLPLPTQTPLLTLWLGDRMSESSAHNEVRSKTHSIGLNSSVWQEQQYTSQSANQCTDDSIAEIFVSSSPAAT